MRHHYGKFEGQPFATPDMLFPQPAVVQFILQHGEPSLDYLDQGNEDHQELVEQMIQAGLLERDEKTGKLKLTPRMVRGIQHRALLDIFAGLQRGNRDGHLTQAPGASAERSEGTRPYEFGDPLSDADLGATLRNAAHRQARESPGAAEPASRPASRDREGAGTDDQGHPSAPPMSGDQSGEAGNHGWQCPLPYGRGSLGGSPRSPAPVRLPLRLDPRDLEVHVTEGQADLALCILMDLSGSMMRYGRFYHAKRIALGMAELVRSRFPQDTVDYVAFHSAAERVAERDLPMLMPKPISIHDSKVRLRVPLQKALAQPGRIPQHFTNLQLGLRLARQTLARRGAANKLIFVITDGQPTAHVEAGADGEEMLHLVYPPSEKTAMLTLQEALRCQQRGIRMATFALSEDYLGMEWIGFVEQMTRLTRGVAYYCTGDDLSSTVIESYLSGKKRKRFVG